jgi:nucleoid-associated protein YgaU
VGLILLAGGCADLEPMEDPDVADYHLTIDTMRTAAREADRNLADLRLELDSQRQELSAALIARAQLEGRLREVERRLADARHIVELQREELAGMRAERERSSKHEVPQVPRSRQKSKRAPLADRPSMGQPLPIPAEPPMGFQPPQDAEPILPPSGLPEPQSSPAPPPVVPGPPVSQLNGGTAATTLHRENGLDAGAYVRSIAVQAGDTLWRLARRYGVDVEALRSLNGLSGNLIQVGQALMIPETGVR